MGELQTRRLRIQEVMIQDPASPRNARRRLISLMTMSFSITSFRMVVIKGMRFARLFSFILLMGGALLFPIPRVSAQFHPSEPIAAPGETLPETPQPHSESSSKGSADEQSPSEQTHTQTGVPEEQPQSGQQFVSSLGTPAASISGTVTDVNGGIVSGATVSLEGAVPGDRQTV